MQDIIPKTLLVVHPIIGSFLTSFLGGNNMSPSWYTTLKKSPLTPPGFVFPIVWTVLYILLGINVMTIYNKIKRLNRPAFFNQEFIKNYLISFEAQLILNLSWSFAFFKFKKPTISLGIVIGMVLLTIYLLYKSWYIDKTAFYILVPYLLWILLATYLNLYIVINN